LASYTTAGLELLPIPIHTEDANAKILEFIDAHQPHNTPEQVT
jgi:hypothetical protein